MVKLQRSYLRTLRLLNKHKAELDKLAAALIEKQTLNGEEIQQLLGFDDLEHKRTEEAKDSDLQNDDDDDDN